MIPIRQLSTHAGRLERWLGKDTVELMSASMKDWYGPPIAISTVPGSVWAHKGGDFKGVIRSGQYMNVVDFAVCRLRRAWKDSAKRAQLQYASGFASLSDILSEAIAGKTRTFVYQKGMQAPAAVSPCSAWHRGTYPIQGATPGNAAAGTAFNSTSSGTFTNWSNPSGGDRQYLVSGAINGSVSGGCMLLYDLLFGVNKTMNSTGNEAVTGVPTRYQSITATDEDYVSGNFLFIQVGGTALANTAHSWTSCTYTDQGGGASTLPDVVGVAAKETDMYDMTPGTSFFCPLEAGDTGIKALTQMHCSALVATGEIWFMIGRPIAWFPAPLANYINFVDGIVSSFNFARIYDSACLAFIELKNVVNGVSYSGTFTTVAG